MKVTPKRQITSKKFSLVLRPGKTYNATKEGTRFLVQVSDNTPHVSIVCEGKDITILPG